MKKKTASSTASAAAATAAPDEPRDSGPVATALEPIVWKEVCSNAETFVRTHPAAAVVIAASVGFVVGRMFR